MNTKQQLTAMFNASVKAVSGFEATKRALAPLTDYHPDMIIGIGKAASGMCSGALASIDTHCRVLLVTKYHHCQQNMHDNEHVQVIEAAHPIPDQNSLIAGSVLLDTIDNMPAMSKLLLLVSGGASAVAELLPEDMDLARWQKLTDQMISSGFDIGQINAKRKETSLLKDGKLLANFKGSSVKVLAISDVQGDDICVIGSGIGDTKHLAEGINSDISLIGTNEVARKACASYAQELGFEVISNTENMYLNITQLAPIIASQLLTASPGVYIFGGEPTVNLPDNPGSGGRNQSLALLLAQQIKDRDDITILVAGTDGSDGPTDAAGAIIDGNSANDIRALKQALLTADAGSYLRNTGDIFITGPTNTNVMDLVIAIIK
jgi:hydroxypyruvate reductase